VLDPFVEAGGKRLTKNPRAKDQIRNIGSTRPPRYTARSTRLSGFADTFRRPGAALARVDVGPYDCPTYSYQKSDISGVLCRFPLSPR